VTLRLPLPNPRRFCNDVTLRRSVCFSRPTCFCNEAPFVFAAPPVSAMTLRFVCRPTDAPFVFAEPPVSELTLPPVSDSTLNLLLPTRSFLPSLRFVFADPAVTLRFPPASAAALCETAPPRSEQKRHKATTKSPSRHPAPWPHRSQQRQAMAPTKHNIQTLFRKDAF
jgi:hypothetical protein